MRYLLIIISAMFIVSCASIEVVPYEAPVTGPTANLTLKTDRMWATTSVVLYIVKSDTTREKTTLVELGQLQNRNLFREEILAFDVELSAAEPIRMYIRYSYDGGVYVTGCNYPFELTPEPNKQYVIDFIKDTRSCNPKFYVAIGNELKEIAVKN